MSVLLFKMSRTLVDVDFLYNDDEDCVFAKKVLICGITAQSKSYVKEIVYQYPSLNLETKLNKNLKNGHIELNEKLFELTKCLAKFDIIIVKSKEEKAFLERLTPSTITILGVEE